MLTKVVRIPRQAVSAQGSKNGLHGHSIALVNRVLTSVGDSFCLLDVSPKKQKWLSEPSQGRGRRGGEACREGGNRMHGSRNGLQENATSSQQRTDSQITLRAPRE